MRPFLYPWWVWAFEGGMTLMSGAWLYLNTVYSYEGVSLWVDFAASIASGMVFGYAASNLFHSVQRARRWRHERKLPVGMQMQPDDDGNWTAIATTVGGESLVVRMPEGYDPYEDNGRFALEEILKATGAVPDEIIERVRQEAD